MSKLLNWSLANSQKGPSAPANGNESAADTNSSRGLPQEALAELLGGPSDADLMRASMAAITSDDPAVSLADKTIAFDNLEQLIENLDNANNLEPLGLWTPLLAGLAHAEPEMRRMAAWCVGTAVQNNEVSQERCVAAGGVERLVALACRAGEDAGVRRKGCYALSSVVRNYQPAMDIAARELRALGRDVGRVDADNMDAIDDIMAGLRQEAGTES
jgi:hsp70-interacting protein